MIKKKKGNENTVASPKGENRNYRIMILMLRDHLIIDSAESARPLKLLPEAEYIETFFL
jgi:chorismate-pyruvate lyase